MRKRYDNGEIQVPPKPQVNVKLFFKENEKSEELLVPVVGYTGFVPGKKARNVYGESYQQTVIDVEARKGL